MTPINQEGVQQAAQVMLAYTSDPRNTTPNNMLEGMVSAKSLLRALMDGSLVVCEPGQKAAPEVPTLPVQEDDLPLEADAKPAEKAA